MNKNKILLVLVIIIAMVSCEKQYKVGEKGLGGGTIFYVSNKGFTPVGTDSVCHYMECSPILSDGASWCSQMPYTECCELETADEIGSGRQNTANIMGAGHNGGELSEENCAALICSNYQTETTQAGDWWLPSKDELNLIYVNLVQKGFPFDVRAESSDSGWYWSSSQNAEAPNKAWGQGFASGSQDCGNKNDKIAVIAVRAW